MIIMSYLSGVNPLVKDNDEKTENIKEGLAIIGIIR
jgi:hypothetical protein